MTQPTAAKGHMLPPLIRSILRYDRGAFFWRHMAPEILPDQRARKRWNTLYSGKPVLQHRHLGGYLTIGFCRRSFLVHRLVWLFEKGDWPQGHIDHLNGVRDDNRIENLRVATNSENMRNQKLRSDNTSGTAGLSYCRQRRAWRAYVCGRSLGRFATRAEALDARKAAQAAMGFTVRHGMLEFSS